jgi:DnaJ-domain-containing protein 1
MLEMSLDHDSGEMNGVVLAGSLAGRRLDELDASALSALARELAAADPDGIRRLEAYMDRRFPGWREDTQFDADTRRGSSAGAASARAGGGTMTREEAYEILGLAPGSGDDQIRRAHRDLMKKLHPDQGGSTYLAARVNQAKDILLSRHR